MATTDSVKKKKKAKADDGGPRICPHCGNVIPAAIQRPARAHVDELTDRQLAVLRMVAMGHTAQQIGDALNISRRTAEFHRGALMNKLGMRSASELTVYALANNLVNL